MNTANNVGLLPKPDLLLTKSFNNIETNLNQNFSCFSSVNYPQNVSPFPPWYNAANLNYSSKVEDHNFTQQRWQNLPKPTKPFHVNYQGNQAQANSNKNQDFYCDTCDRAFPNAATLHAHQAEHTTCNIQGCKFKAHPKIVSLHKKMQHQTGLASKIMSLDTPEDILKWREERKRNFPTTENIERRKKEVDEKMARGEVLENKFFGKMRGRGRRNQMKNQRFSTESNCQDTQDKTNFRNRGRGRGGRSRGNKRNRFNRGDGNFESADKSINTNTSPNSNTKTVAGNLVERKLKSSTQVSSSTTVLQPFQGILKNYEIIETIPEEICYEPRIKKSKPNEELSEGEIIDSDDNSDVEATIVTKHEGTHSLPSQNPQHAINKFSQDHLEINTADLLAKDIVIQACPTELPKENKTTQLVSNSLNKINKEEYENLATNIDNLMSKESHIEMKDGINFFETKDSDDEAPEEISSKVKEETVNELTKPASGALGSLIENYGTDSDTESESTKVIKNVKPKESAKIKEVAKKVPAPNLYPVQKRQTSLLEKLLANEIRHERNVILQCINHIVKNNFFDDENKIIE